MVLVHNFRVNIVTLPECIDMIVYVMMSHLFIYVMLNTLGLHQRSQKAL